MPDGASPSGKAPGFGPGISEVRILPPQPLKVCESRLFYCIISHKIIKLIIECYLVKYASKEKA